MPHYLRVVTLAMVSMSAVALWVVLTDDARAAAPDPELLGVVKATAVGGLVGLFDALGVSWRRHKRNSSRPPPPPES